jgi:predicted permease
LLTNLLISLPFFALIACGFAAGKIGLMPAPAVNGLNAFVFYFALPALMFRTMALHPFADLYHPVFLEAWLVGGLIVYGGVALAARLSRGVSWGAAGLFGLAAVFSNSGYLGIPLVANLLGPGAIVPVALTIVVDVGVLLSLTLVLAELSAGGARHPRGVLRALGRGVLFNPLPLSILAGMGVSWLGRPLPGPLEEFTRLLSGAAGPGALFLIGAALAVRPVARGAGALGLMVAGKLLLHPAVILVVMVFAFDVPPHWALAAMLNAAIPTAANVYVLAERYGVEPERVSTAVLLSTALSVFTFTGFARLLGV